MNTHDGYVDLQVNGYAGVDFNADQFDLAEVIAACELLRTHGVAGILATVITDDIDAMCRRLRNVCQARDADPRVADLIWGIHIEGPFLNETPGYIGAHPPAAARPADPVAMQCLLEAAGGLTRIVTLAPERDPGFVTTRLLADADIRISAGHCNPSLDELRGAIDAGLSLFTHLGNGCPLEIHRHDNIVQRVLSLADHLRIGFIADGVHVPIVALGNYLKCAGLDRAFIVTDAIAAAGQGPGVYRIGNQQVIVDDNLATWAADKSHLVGSAITMPAATARLRAELGLTDPQIKQLACDNPRAVLGAHRPALSKPNER